MRSLNQTNYKEAYLYHPKSMDTSKEWMVIYYYRIPGTDHFKQFKERFRMNYIKDAKERYFYGAEAAKWMNEKLKAGFSPFESINIKSQSTTSTSGKKLPTILLQLDTIAKEEKEGATDSKKASYTEQYNRFKKFIEEKNMKDISIHGFTEDDADIYRKWLDKEQKLATKTVNQAIGYMEKFWKLAGKKKWCGKNVFEDVERLDKRSHKQVDKSEEDEERFEPLTRRELETIMNHLTELGAHDYIRFCMMIFYAFGRPIELTRLKVKDIDLDAGMIRFRKGQTKNGKGDFVQIVPPLRPYLEQLKLETLDPEMYLFGSEGDGFAPGYKQLTRNRACQRWNDLVIAPKKEGGLGIPKNQYALKHTGNIQILLQNKGGKLNYTWLTQQNRHHSISQTQTYFKKIGVFTVEVEDLKFFSFAPAA